MDTLQCPPGFRLMTSLYRGREGWTRPPRREFDISRHQFPLLNTYIPYSTKTLKQDSKNLWIYLLYYMDTQAMGLGKATGIVKPQKPFQPSKQSLFTDLARKELKDIINEVLDERSTTLNYP